MRRGFRLVSSRAGRWQKLGEIPGSDHGRRTMRASRNSQVFVSGLKWGCWAERGLFSESLPIFWRGWTLQVQRGRGWSLRVWHSIKGQRPRSRRVGWE